VRSVVLNTLQPFVFTNQVIRLLFPQDPLPAAVFLTWEWKTEVRQWKDNLVKKSEENSRVMWIELVLGCSCSQFIRFIYLDIPHLVQNMHRALSRVKIKLVFPKKYSL